MWLYARALSNVLAMVRNDTRIGRTIANGRFTIDEWLGHSESHGVAFAVDATSGHRVRLTFAPPSVVAHDDVVARLSQAVPSLADVVYLGPVDSDDGWGAHSIVMAERAADPDARLLGSVPVALDALPLAVRLTRLVARAHAYCEPLGTLQPENVFIGADGAASDLWMGRGARLWTLAQPSSSAVMSPFAIGYAAPEATASTSGLSSLDDAVDIFSIGVIVAERLLGAFPYPRQSPSGLVSAQATGAHAPLPDTDLGRLIARCLAPTPERRPSFEELLTELASFD